MAKKKNDDTAPVSIGPGSWDRLEMRSPPFPLATDSVDQLYDRVLELAEWLHYYREISNHYIGKVDCVVKPRKLATSEEHSRTALHRLVRISVNMQRVRETWDAVIRVFERSWDSGGCKDACHGVFHLAADVLDTAYMSQEMLEARQDALQQQHVRALMGPLASLLKQRPDDEEEDGSETPGQG